MRKSIAMRVGQLGVLSLGLAVLAGCGSKPPSREPTAGEQNIMKLGRLYVAFAGAAKDGLGPASAEELKKWAKENDKRLTDLGLTQGELDGVFISPRDNQPYQVQPKRHPAPGISGTGGGPPKGAPPGVRGAAPKSPGYGQPGILVNEQTGEGGTRMVFMSGSRIDFLDEAEFNRLLRGE